MSGPPFPWGPAPEGYIPGLGRGAIGFVSHIENGVIELEDDSAKNANVSSKKAKKIEEADQAADSFYQMMDEKIQNRNKSLRKTVKEKMKRNIRLFDEIHTQFATVRPELRTITANEWENLPEIGETTYHRPKWDMYTYASGRMFTGDFEDSELYQLNQEAEAEEIAGDSEMKKSKDMMAIGNARSAVLAMQLEKITKADEKEDKDIEEEINKRSKTIIKNFKDLDYAARLYRTMTHANPLNEESWIMRARVEEARGRPEVAKNTAIDGLAHCPASEGLILEAARLAKPPEAISMLQGLLRRDMSHSEKCWLKLIALQSHTHAQTQTIEDALRAIPTSVPIWRAAALADPEHRTEIFQRALSFIGDSKEVWLEAIHGSENYEAASGFAEGAVKRFPTDADILVAWAMADERFNEGANIQETIGKAVEANPDHNWVLTAERCEQDGALQTAAMIIRSIQYSDKINEGAEHAERCNLPCVASECYRKIAQTTNDWSKFLEFESINGDVDGVCQYLLENDGDNPNTIVQVCRYLSPEDSISVLSKAFENHGDNEQIAMALVESIARVGNIKEAMDVAHNAALEIKSPSLFKRAVSYAEQFPDIEGILKEGVSLFPSEAELWIRLANHSEDRTAVLQKAIKACHGAGIIYVELARSALNKGVSKVRVRALLENARRMCPREAIVWLCSAEFEASIDRRLSILEEAKTKVTLPELVWARAIELRPMEERYTLVKSAIEDVGQKRELMLLKAVCEWRHGAVDKGRSTFEEITSYFPTWGDGWVYRVLFERQYGKDLVKKIAKKAIAQSITSGFIWEAAASDPSTFGLNQAELLDEVCGETSDPLTTDTSIFGHILDM